MKLPFENCNRRLCQSTKPALQLRRTSLVCAPQCSAFPGQSQSGSMSSQSKATQAKTRANGRTSLKRTSNLAPPDARWHSASSGVEHRVTATPGRPVSVPLWECLGWALPCMHRAFTRIRQLLELLLQSATALHVSFQHQHLRSAVSVIVKNPGCRLAANPQKPGSKGCPRTSRPAGKPGRGHEKLGAAFILRDCKIFWGCILRNSTPQLPSILHTSPSLTTKH